MGLSPAVAGLLGGMGGGVAQAYATMGEYTASSYRTWQLVTLRYKMMDTIHCRLTASAPRHVASN